MKKTKQMEKGWSRETIELIEISKEMLRISRKMREEEQKLQNKQNKKLDPYEEALKNNPYISKEKIDYY